MMMAASLLLINFLILCTLDIVCGRGIVPIAPATVLWTLESKSNETGSSLTAYAGDGTVVMSESLDGGPFNATLSGFVASPCQNTGFALYSFPVGFQEVNLTTGMFGNFFDIQRDFDLSIDAYVYSPNTSIFVFLVSSEFGPGHGRIAAYESTNGAALWTLSNTDMNNTVESPLPDWTWNPSVVTPILSRDNTTVYINFLSNVVSLAAFDLSNGSIKWSISTLMGAEVERELGGEFPISSNAALGGLLMTGSSTIFAGIYDKATRSQSMSSFNSGMLAIDSLSGIVNTDLSWVYNQTLGYGPYRGGIRGTPASGASNLYASDQFWGLLAWNRQDPSTVLYNTRVPNNYNPFTLVLSEDRNYLFGIRDMKYPTGYIARSGLVQWTTKTNRLTCNVLSVNRNPDPVVAGEIVYYSCGNIWYAFVGKNGTLYNHGNATAFENGKSGLFVSLSVVDGVLYTTEKFEGEALSYIKAWNTIPTNSVMDEPSSAPTMNMSPFIEASMPVASGKATRVVSWNAVAYTLSYFIMYSAGVRW